MAWELRVGHRKYLGENEQGPPICGRTPTLRNGNDVSGRPEWPVMGPQIWNPLGSSPRSLLRTTLQPPPLKVQESLSPCR